MVLSRRPFLILSTFFMLFSSVMASSFAIQAAPKADSTRITAAANVTLRAMPSPGAPVVALLPLGTEVADAGPPGLDKAWVRVKLGDAREVWVLATLTRPIDPAWRWPTFDKIIADRLGRKGDGFPASVELVAFIDRVAPEYSDPDGLARLEFSLLRAMSSALAAIPRNGARREPYQSWLASRKSEVVYDEPGGRWMLSDSSIWERHARLAATVVADDIGWLAVTNGVSGDCEGRLACYLTARNRLQGEYLRRHPSGRHAAEAVSVVKSTAEALTAPAKSSAGYAFDRARDCRALSESVEALTSALRGTRAEGRDAAIERLVTIKKRCE